MIDLPLDDRTAQKSNWHPQTIEEFQQRQVERITSIHDDIIDEAKERRTIETVHSKFNTNNAILTGVHSYAIGLSVIASLNNPYLINKISTCVLENMSVKYGGSVGYQAFEPDEAGDTPPVETEISLQFKELEIITKTRAKEIVNDKGESDGK